MISTMTDSFQYRPRKGNESVMVEIIHHVQEISMDLDEFDTQYPNSIAKARKSLEWPKWEKAISTELEMLREKNTWELSDIPAEHTAIGNRWVFTKKFDEHGNLTIQGTACHTRIFPNPRTRLFRHIFPSHAAQFISHFMCYCRNDQSGNCPNGYK